MALTFDDLPYVAAGQRNDLGNARRATAAILAALSARRAPAVGFVNEGKLHTDGEVNARTALLQQWIDGGATLGNHTFSHVDLNAVNVEQFQADIVKGETITRRLMRAREPYRLYFRHPMTHTGDTRAKKEAVEAFLAARGYTIAPHTIENSDYIFNAVYVRSRASGNQATAGRVREAYLDFTIAAAEFAERIARRIFDREIPQTILLHANDINADCLDDLLRRLEGRGYRFVTLDDAMADQAYGTKDTIVSRFGPTWLWRWARSTGVDVGFDDDPEPPAWITKRYNQRGPARPTRGRTASRPASR